MLAQEPWCYTPEQIARLTDWQIENLYAKPAHERAEQMRRESASSSMPAPSAGPGMHPANAPHTVETVQHVGEPDGPPGEPGSPEHRHAIVDALMGMMGLSRERADASYDRQLADHVRATANG